MRVTEHPRPNLKIVSPLSANLVLGTMTPKPKPLSMPLELYKDLTPLDRACYVAWTLLIGAWMYYVTQVL